jgi:hypothetical protein
MATTLFAPVARDPDGAGMWRAAIGAMNPDVAVAIPAVIAGHPDPAGMRCGRNNLYGPGWRWADTNDNADAASRRVRFTKSLLSF